MDRFHRLLRCFCVAEMVSMSAGVTIAQTFPYDWSSPLSALESLRKAYDARDKEGISAGTYSGPGSPVMSAHPDAEAQYQERFAAWLSELTVRHVDKRLLPRLKEQLADKTFDDAARLVCSYANKTAKFPPDQKHVCALYLVRQGSKWRWYLDPYRFIDRWSYDFRTPEKAYRSLLSAIEREDLPEVHEQIDPAMRANVDRETFVGTARERLDKLEQWEKDEQRQREQARREGRKVPLPSPPPFKAMGVRTDDGMETEPFVRDGKECAKVWQLSPQNQRVSNEEFVKQGEEWYWRPKPEYNIWVLNRQAATSSAAP